MRWILASWGASLRGAMEYRATTLLQAGFMLANNFLFLTFWALFFRRVPDVAGWTLPEVALCYGMAAGAFGLSAILLGGTFELSATIASGGLDTWLLRPRPVLLQGLASRMRFAGFGDLLTAPILLALAGDLTPARVAAFVAGLLAGAAAFTSFLVACHALAFWIGRSEELSLLGINAILSFALYPPSIFGRPARLVLFTVVPAGLMSWLPVEMVLRPSPLKLALLFAGSAAVTAASLLFWSRGLRRYESGNLTQAVGA